MRNKRIIPVMLLLFFITLSYAYFSGYPTKSIISLTSGSNPITFVQHKYGNYSDLNFTVRSLINGSIQHYNSTSVFIGGTYRESSSPTEAVNCVPGYSCLIINAPNLYNNNLSDIGVNFTKYVNGSGSDSIYMNFSYQFDNSTPKPLSVFIIRTIKGLPIPLLGEIAIYNFKTNTWDAITPSWTAVTPNLTYNDSFVYDPRTYGNGNTTYIRVDLQGHIDVETEINEIIVRYGDQRINISAYGLNFFVNSTAPGVTYNFTINESILNQNLLNCPYGITQDYDCLNLFNFTTGISQYINFSYAYSYFNDSKVNITIFDEQSLGLITDPITIQLYNQFETYNITTITGNAVFTGLTPQYHTVKLFGSDYGTRLYSVDLSTVEYLQISAYLNKNTSDLTFTILDDDTDLPLSNVLIKMFRQLGGSWVQIESHFSDLTGRAVFNYQENVNYRFELSKSEYEDLSFYLDPVLFQEYTVRMTKIFYTNISYDFDRVSVTYTPTLFYINRTNTFVFTIDSPLNELYQYGYVIEWAGAFGFDIQTGYEPGGETLSSNVNITNAQPGDVVQLDYYYCTNTAGCRDYTYYFDIAGFYGNNTLINIREKTYGMGLGERLLILVLGALFIVGIASLIGRPVPGMILGISWFGILSYMGFVPLWSVLIPITITLIIIASTTEI